ncbi:enoyl-CoA hydratase/isomerase family protein [Nocardioides pelophilus]|uniref:enoyl-CoA hydratase/isomerase family protein n=1 Tax=Nocardioides pelophilus TaxID=2172019 RepID=UPI001C7F9380|nr:enoyl-CoA hydratase/isomerase family protein [Nocardioides pelophilus]
MKAADGPTPVTIDISAGIATLTLDRPGAINAVTTALAAALEQALRHVGASAEVRVVVVRGAGGNFCAGGDFEEVQRLRSVGREALRTLFAAFRDACAAVSEIPQPVIAAVEGVAMAGGFELMQASDIVLVRDDARISDNHVNFGMVPGGGGSQRLPRLVGRQRATALLLSGDRLSGADAVAWGLAYRSFPADTFDEAVAAFARKLADRRPDAVQTIKRLVRDGLTTDVEKGLDLELDAVVDHIAGDAGGTSVSAFADRKEGTS